MLNKFIERAAFSKRHFLKLSSLAVISKLSSFELTGTYTIKQKASELFQDSSYGRLGNWIMKYLSQGDAELLFQKHLSTLKVIEVANVDEIKTLIDNDYKVGRVVDIEGMRLSVTETLVCILANSSRNIGT